LSTNLSLPTSSDVKSFWSRPEGKMAIGIYAAIIGGVVWFWGIIVPFLLNMLVDTLHMVYLGGILAAISYLIFGKRPQLMFRVLVRKFTSLFVAVYPIEIIEDKLKQMKKRRDKMNDQIALVNGSITKLKRQMDQNTSDAAKGFGMAAQAQKMAGSAQDDESRFRMQLAMKQAANRAQRRQQANIGYANLLERLQKVYKFLTHYATNVDFFIEDTQDEIDQKKTEYETTQTAFGAMKQAMAVIKGNATEEDIYDQAFDQIETTVSTQLGVMDDLQRVSQNFMDGIDVQNGAVDDDALKALNAFEQKTLTSGTTDFSMVTGDKSGQRAPVPVMAGYTKSSSTPDDFNDLLR
jgi:hypothetical protein